MKTIKIYQVENGFLINDFGGGHEWIARDLWEIHNLLQEIFKKPEAASTLDMASHEKDEEIPF